MKLTCRPRPLLAVIVAVAAVAGCAGSDDGATSATPNDSVIAATVADAPVPATVTPDTATFGTVTSDTVTSNTTVDTAPTATENEQAEFEPLAPGPYDVGVQTITITDVERNRPLTVDVWFPVTDAGEAPAHQYTFAGAVYPSPTGREVPASAIATDGPFPLVIFSHGSPGIRFLNSTLPEALAANGYIVASADHTGNTVIDLFAGTLDPQDVVAVNRPLDVQTMITAMTDPADPETATFSAQVDPDRIAVAGHSVGGYTAYATVSGVTNDVATVPGDPRVDAIVTVAPATGGVTDEMFAAISVPSLVMVGTDDEATPADPNVTRVWDLSSSEPLYRADFVGANHQSFADFCEYAAYFATLPSVVPLIADTVEEYGALSCAPEAMPSGRAHELTATFAVSFLDSIFRDGTMIDETNTVMPDDVIFTTR